LVIGSEGHGRHVRSHTWANLPRHVNVADFDVVILDFTEIEGVRIDPDAVLRPEQFGRLFLNNGTVVAIGVPTAKFKYVYESPVGVRTTEILVDWWLPANLPAQPNAGEVVKLVEDEWKFWIDSLNGYRWHFWRQPRLKDNSSVWLQGASLDTTVSTSNGLP
jgi:hypothetical protein